MIAHLFKTIKVTILKLHGQKATMSQDLKNIYDRDEATDDVCGIYFFENKEKLAAFRDTELAKTIPTAYEAIDVRREVYEVLYPLGPEKGPLS